MDELPFRPTPPDAPPHRIPPSVPHGLRLELSRSKIVPGQEQTAADWMAMLNTRHDRCVDTLAAERACFEASFFNREADGSLWLYHLTLAADDSRGLDPTASPVDAAHHDFGRRCKLPGWEELQPMFMVAPAHITDAFVRWAATGRP